APKTSNEILAIWAGNLKSIQKSRNIPKLITSFARDLIEFNGTGDEIARGYMKQTNEILTGTAGERIKKDEEVEEEDELNVQILQNFDAIPDVNQVYSDDKFTEENQTCKNNLKRKLGDDELPGYDRLIFLFNDSNEDKIIEKIDENILEEERKLPLASNNKDSSKFIFDEMLNAFQTYQNKIPKARRQLSQDFANHIKWKYELVSKDIQDYFDSSCEILGNSDENKDLKHFDSNVQFLKNNIHFFQEMLMEEHLKMTSSYPLFHGTFTSDRIKHSWGEIHVLSSSDTRNEKSDPFKKARMGKKVDMKVTLLKTPNKFEALFGEVSGELGQFGIPTACRKKRFLDKVKLIVTMRDSINRLLKEYNYVSNEKRLDIIVFGWLQFDWMGSGVYRFGLIDQCRIPADIDDCDILENAYCILKLLQ
ncbi:1791_t:CDS:2, partial [Racocetra persica]